MRNRPGPNNRVSAWNRRGRGPENNVCRVAPSLFSQYIARMLWRVRNPRGRPSNAPAATCHNAQTLGGSVRHDRRQFIQKTE